jgi:REP element-mobilizing transposase RayT
VASSRRIPRRPPNKTTQSQIRSHPHYFRWEGHDFQSCRYKLTSTRLPAAEVCREAYAHDAPPGTYFVTFSTWERTRLFVVEVYAKVFLQTLYGHRRQGSFQLHAFVLMPEHIHLLLAPANEVTLERVMQLIKGGYSHKFGSEFGRKKEVWQRGFTEFRNDVLCASVSLW